MLIFGTKKLKGLGSDLGGAVKGFKDSMKDGEEEEHRRHIEKRNDETRDDEPK